MYIFFTEVVVFIISILVILKNNKFITEKFGLLDVPNNRRLHKKPTPLIGGLIAFILLLEFYLISYFFDGQFFNLSYLILPSVLFLIGIFDDSNDLNPNLKLLLIGLSFYFFLIFFPEFNINKLNFSTFNILINTGKINIFFTILCLLLFINASNMTDGINGLFLGLSIVYFLYLYFTYNFNNNFILSILLILFILFYFNCKNAFFMGDSGVFLISSIYALSLIEAYHLERSSLKSIEEIFILLMMPGLDMFRLFIERIFKKRHPFKPDRNHFHHLLKKKFSDETTLIIYLVLVCIGPVLFRLNLINTASLIATIILVFFSATYYLKKLKKPKILS
tara:strand:+ start:369 stop:1376 length:1008 start_codon:yes stop_codon:yes gene_type:complete